MDNKVFDRPGTTGVGVEASFALFVRVSIGTQVVWDEKGNVGIQRYATIGAGSPSVSAGGAITTTNAETIADLQGLGRAGGASVKWPGYEDVSRRWILWNHSFSQH